MTRHFINRKRFKSGVTLVESLAVVIIISVLMTAAMVPFSHTMTSYKGQYDTESVQLESQRAIAEFVSYGKRSTRSSISTGETTFSLNLMDADANQVTFVFTVNPDIPVTEDTEAYYTGTFGIIRNTIYYEYATSWRVPQTGPFVISPSGVSICFEIDSAGAPIRFKSFAPAVPL
jgi:prepilin-type N-terminal cleavage/methylation domain-containing protein